MEMFWHFKKYENKIACCCHAADQALVAIFKRLISPLKWHTQPQVGPVAAITSSLALSYHLFKAVKLHGMHFAVPAPRGTTLYSTLCSHTLILVLLHFLLDVSSYCSRHPLCLSDFFLYGLLLTYTM